MKSKKPPYRLSKTLTMVEPKHEEAFPILFAEWEKLKSMVEHIKDPPILRQSLAWGLLGAAGSFLVGAITLCGEVFMVRRIICWAISAAFAFSGVVVLLFAREERKGRKETSQAVIREMQFIEARYKK